MSYIDQDALLERIDGIYDCNDMRFEPNDKCCTVPDDCKGCKWAETKRAIRKIVENMPSADVRTVVLCSVVLAIISLDMSNIYRALDRIAREIKEKRL